MPYRKVILAAGEIYHVFNRGVASMPIFDSIRDYSRFMNIVDYYRFVDLPMSFSHLLKLQKEERAKILSQLIKNDVHSAILAFCLMPNHFHFLLKQQTEKGIATFLGNLQNSYAKYFNTKYERIGPLFQPMFKAVRIETNEQLIHVSRYIHLNPSTGYIVEPKNLLDYRWSSLETYVGKNSQVHTFVEPEIVLGVFKENKSYEKFVFDQADYQKELKDISHLILE